MVGMEIDVPFPNSLQTLNMRSIHPDATTLTLVLLASYHRP